MSIDHAGTVAPISSKPRLGRWRATVRPADFIATAFAITACAVIAYLNARLFFIDWSLPKGDYAADDLQVVLAKHLTLFHGNYSRLSFYHPGPFYFQWMAIFEWLFVDRLHIFASPLGVAYFSIAFLHVIAFTLYFRLWLLWRQNIAIAAAALIITNAVPFAVIGENYIVSVWAPHMYVASALMVTTGLIGMAALGPSWLPLFIFGLAQLVHGHASFIGLAPMMAVIAFAVAWIAGRLPVPVWPMGKAAAYVKAHSIPFILSAAIVALFALPILIETIVAWPGELPKYFQFAHGQSHRIVDAARYVSSFVPRGGFWALVFLLPSNQTKSSSTPTDYRFTGILVLAVGCLPAFFYAWRGIDTLTERYLIDWMSPFVGAALVLAIFYFVSLLRALWLRFLLVAAATIVSLSVYRLEPRLPDTRSTAMTAAAFDLLTKRAVPGEKIALQIDHDPAGWPPAWSETVAIIADMNRNNEDFLCIERSSWHLLFTEKFRCKASDKISEVLYIVAKGKPHSDRIAELADAEVVPTHPPAVGSELNPNNLVGLSAVLLGDWSAVEPWGIWSDGNKASISFDARLLPPTFAISIEARLFPNKPPPEQTVSITDGDGRELGKLTNTAAQQTVSVRIELAKPASGRMVTVNFEIPRPVTPHDIGVNRDARQLGVGLEKLTFEN
jgi:hypothetical protein